MHKKHLSGAGIEVKCIIPVIISSGWYELTQRGSKVHSLVDRASVKGTLTVKSSDGQVYLKALRKLEKELNKTGA